MWDILCTTSLSWWFSPLTKHLQIVESTSILAKFSLLCALTSTKFVCLASRTVTKAWTSSINFCFSSSSKFIYHLASRVFPARFWIKMKRICAESKHEWIKQPMQCRQHTFLEEEGKKVQKTTYHFYQVGMLELAILLSEDRTTLYDKPDSHSSHKVIKNIVKMSGKE